MSHDTGTFGELLAKCIAAGVNRVHFEVNLQAHADSEVRWLAYDGGLAGCGRTGEEALRNFVQRLGK